MCGMIIDFNKYWATLNANAVILFHGLNQGKYSNYV